MSAKPPEPKHAPCFDEAFRVRLEDLFRWRRDVRRFRTVPLPAGLIEDLLEIAAVAPSVGLSQPWKFVMADDARRRAAIRACFESCNAQALAGFEGERAALYAKLKLAGLAEAPCHIAVFADPDTEQGHGLGRRTMPATIEYSAVMAIHTLWLAARAAGIGLGWVSILDPAVVANALDVPENWVFIGYLCVGYAEEDSEMPALEEAGWENRRLARESILRR